MSANVFRGAENQAAFYPELPITNEVVDGSALSASLNDFYARAFATRAETSQLPITESPFALDREFTAQAYALQAQHPIDDPDNLLAGHLRAAQTIRVPWPYSRSDANNELAAAEAAQAAQARNEDHLPRFYQGTDDLDLSTLTATLRAAKGRRNEITVPGILPVEPPESPVNNPALEDTVVFGWPQEEAEPQPKETPALTQASPPAPDSMRRIQTIPLDQRRIFFSVHGDDENRTFTVHNRPTTNEITGNVRVVNGPALIETAANQAEALPRFSLNRLYAYIWLIRQSLSI